MSQPESSSASQLPPDSLIGLVGGGQLGMFFTQAAQRLGYRVCCFCNHADEPAARFADEVICGPFADNSSIDALVNRCDVVTYEFESIPAATLAAIDARCSLLPPLNVVQTAQNRAIEKNFLRTHSIPTADFCIVESFDDLKNGLQTLGCASVLKTACDGYDGKGQWKLNGSESEEELESVWAEVDNRSCTLEKLIDLDFEVSMVIAGDQHGNVVQIGPIRIRHVNHILDTSWVEHSLDNKTEEAIRSISNQVAEHFGLVSTLCVEFFISKTEQVLVNEIAPRPHNSGHLTIDAFSLSQFDLQALAVTGHAFSDSKEVKHAVMVNLLGDLWDGQELPQFDEAAKHLGSCEHHLHLYGKKEARVGRKMGHVTITGPSQESAIEAANKYREFLHARASAPSAT